METETLTKTGATGVVWDTVHPAGSEQKSSRACDRSGAVLAERYQLTRKLGEGGMGEVYEGRHLLLGRRVAVKLLREEYARQERHRERFVREAKALASLYSHYIVQVTDFSEIEGGLPFMVMEYLEGEDLRQCLARQGTLPVAQAVSLILDVCEGVGDAHAQGLVHRDLKPENLFITRGQGGTRHCKVLDFGVAKLRNAATFTREGALVGTVQYMAPEQVLGHKELDDRVDVFALGAILFECLCGAPAFDGDRPEVILYKILHEEPPRLRSRNADLPPALEPIVLRALSRDLAARYQNVAEFAQALVQFAATADRTALRDVRPNGDSALGNSVTSVARSAADAAGAAAGPPRRRGRLQLQLAFASVTLLLVAGAWALWPGRAANTSQQSGALLASAAMREPSPACVDTESAAGREVRQFTPKVAPERPLLERDVAPRGRAARPSQQPVSARVSRSAQPVKALAGDETLELDPNPYK